MAEETEVLDFSKLSLDEKCGHKNWKARVSAYEELIKVFPRIDDEKSPEWNKYTSLVRKFPADSNAAAQEKGLEATLLFLESSFQAGRIVGEVVSTAITKGLIAPKQKSKELSADIVLMCIEIEKYEVVQEEFLKAMEVKNPKVVSATIGLITHALRDFGPKIFNLKLLMKKIPVLIEDRDKTVREETKKLIVEFYRWLGAGFKAHLTGLKPVVMTELEAEFEKLGSEKPQQNRYLRSQQAKKDAPAQSEEGGEQEDAPVEDAAPDVDPYDLLDPVDILSKLPNDLNSRTESAKWQERKEVLEELLVLASNPKLETGDYSDVLRMLRRIISKDTNVMAVAVAGKCLAGIGNGLKKKFSPYAANCLTTILEKFKEKKINVLTAMREASDACYYATTLEAIQEDVLGALGNKNPNIKMETCLFLARSFTKTPNKTMVDKKLMKPYLIALLANLNEPDPHVRDAAAEALGVASKAMGEKAISPYLQDVEAAKLQKVKDFAEKAVVMAPKAAPAGKAPPKAALPPKAPSSASGPPRTAAAKKVVGKKPVTKKPPATAPSAASHDDAAPSRASNKRSGGSPANSRPTTPTLADDKGGPIDISFMLTPQLIEKLSDKSWKIREDHLDKVSKMIVNKSIQSNLNDFPQALSQRLQDSNRNLALSAIVLCGNLATALGPNAKHHIRSMLPSILACLCDNKANVRSNVIACMNAWADSAGFDKFFQGECIYDALKGNNPFLRLELFSWLTARLPEAKNINKEELNICVPNLLASLEDRNADVRKSAQDVLPAFMIHIGYDAMSRAASRLKPASKNVVQALLDKHKPAIAEGPAKPKVGTATIKKSPATNGISKNDALDPNKAKTVRPGTKPVVVSPGSRKVSECAKRLSESPDSKKTLENLHNSFDDRNDAYEEEPCVSQPYEAAENYNQEDLKSPRGRVWNVPTKYQLDFEAVDKMFGSTDMEPIPPLRLHDTNIDFLKNEVPVTLPPRRTQTRANPALGEFYVPSRASQSIDSVVSQIGSTDIKICMEALVQLDVMLSDLEVANVMATRVDHIFSMISSQLRRSQTLLQTSNPDKVDELNKLYRGMVQLIQTLYKGTLLPLRATKDYLRELVFQLLSLIVDPNMSTLPDSEATIRLINILVCRVIEKSDPNEIFCGLVRLLNENLSKHSANKRLLELTIKCLWKWLKQFGMWADDKAYTFDIEAFLREFFAFMKAHPFSSFSNSDITPLKTMKTIVHEMVDKLGPEKVEVALVRIPDHKSTEAGAYIAKLVQKEMRNRTNANAQHRANNNVDEFFANLPEAADSKETKNQTYMRRLKMIQDRSGLENNIY